MWRLFLLWMVGVSAWAQTLSDDWTRRATPEDAWVPLSDTVPADHLDAEGWFATTLDTAGLGASTALVLVVGATGDTEVWLDDRVLTRTTCVSGGILDGQDVFAPPHDLYRLEHLTPNQTYRVAVHFRPRPGAAVRLAGLQPLLHVALEDGALLLTRQARLVRLVSRHEMFLFGFCVSFALIHLLLYLYFPSLKVNLYYAAFTASAGCLGIVFLGLSVRLDFTLWHATLSLSTLVLAANMLTALLLTYAYLLPRPSRLFRPICVVFTVLSLWGLVQPFLVFEVQGSVILIALAEITRTLLTFRRRGGRPAVPGAHILLYGGVPTGLALLYQLAVFNIPGFPAPFGFYEFPVILYAPLPLMLTMSIMLSRFFAGTNRELELRLHEVQQLNEDKLVQERAHARLSAEHDRKAEELEAARQLQLSMLPKTLPPIKGYRLATYMKTAAEVGGDYYDFFPHECGATLAVVGDATGHGLRAGNMVVATKSLLGAYGQLASPGAILTQMGMGLKRLNLRRMFMAMCAVVVRRETVMLGVAGMPPVLLYRAAERRVTALSKGSLPLGAPVQYSYSDQEVRMNPGDVLLLMSDGLPERFNAARRLFGQDRVEATFAAHAEASPEALIEALVAACDQFAGDHPLEDDLTLLVLKREAEDVPAT